MSNELPQGWASARLADVTEHVSNAKPEDSPEREFGYVDISAIDNSNFKITEVKRFKGKDAPSRARRPIQPNDVLFSNVRTYMRNVALVEPDCAAQLCTTGFTVLRPNSAIQPRYLFRYVLTNAFIDRVTPQQTGTHYPATSDRVVMSEEIALPPVAEQKRIVAKLEKLLIRVDACQQRLAKIPGLLRRFRRAVLAAACAGKLTADWREENPKVESAVDFVRRTQQQRKATYEALCSQATSDGQRKPKRPKNEFAAFTDEEADGLPEHWCITRIGDISDCLDHLRVPVNRDQRLARQGLIPYYGANGQVGTIDEYLFDEDLVLVVEDETFIGREKPFSYVIRGKTWVNNHAHVLRPLGGIPVEFLNIALSYYDFTPLTSGTTGRRKLTQEAMVDTPLAIPPLAEQLEIVRRVNSLFALADRLEARFAEGQKRVDSITQAILAKAFRGELVPTEYELAKAEGRTFESAEELLKRIQENGNRSKTKK